MRVATWNVNSISVRLPQAIAWLETQKPDVLCLQEIKCTEDRFPEGAFRALGYESAVFGQPTYNGVAILSRMPIRDVEYGFPDDEEEAQRRLIAATINGVRVIDIYVPNGSEVGSDKYAYKLAWLARLRRYFDEDCHPEQLLILCGDFNIAPESRDVHDPELWEGRVLCSQPERTALKDITEWGLVDVFRRHHSESGIYSWWDYRGGGFRRNHGLRIDHIWATAPLAETSISAEIDRSVRALERPSDHAPVIAEFNV